MRNITTQGLTGSTVLDPFNRSPNRSRTSVAETHDLTPAVPYERFVPPQQAYYDFERFPLPQYLAELARSIIASGWNLENMDQNPQAKPMDTVDWGDEVDYSGYEWFKDPPPRPEVRYPVFPSTLPNNEHFNSHQHLLNLSSPNQPS